MSSMSVVSLQSLIRSLFVVLLSTVLVWQSYKLALASHISVAGWPAILQKPCVPISGLDDLLVVLKIGATEAQDKVPIHFQTTLRCVPNYLVYSDYEEDISGHHILDALESVPVRIRHNNTDFGIYNRLHQHGRKAFESQELAKWSSVQNTASGMLDNPAWKLDKWKFLPLLDKALHNRPEAKWFVSIEADTYILWSNLVEWLSQYDHTKPYYLGNQVQIGDVVFGHGGSGFIISNPAMRQATEHHIAHQKYYEEYTASQWAGDCVLGKLMADAGVPLTWAWPNLQSMPTSSINYTADSYFRKLWCHRAVSYHHMIPAETEAFWRFEQHQSRKNASTLRHKDVFEQFVMPHLAAERIDWDNLSETPIDAMIADTFDACKNVCSGRKDCMQFSFSAAGCLISSTVKLGHKEDGKLG